MKFSSDRGRKGAMACKTTYPYANGVLATFDNATDEALEGALAGGHTLYKKWRTEGDLDERRVQLRKVAKLLRHDIDKYAGVMTRDMGKLFTEAKGEVELCVEITNYYTDKAEEFLKPCPLENTNGDVYHIKQATGVLVAVKPWNFPFYQIIRVFAPNFMVGNPMILKRASVCPASAQTFDDLVLEASVPVSVFKDLFLSYDQVSKATTDPRVVGVCLAGSERDGASITAEAETNLKKSSTELGGNGAFIILEDASFDLSDKTVFFARLYNADQVCTSSKHFVVVGQENYGKFVDMVVKHFRSAKWGDSMDQTTTLAPLSSAATKEEVLDQIKLTRESGVTVVYGDEPIGHPGNFVMPTALTNITKGGPIYNQEIFDSVVSIYRVDTEKGAIALTSDSNYSFGGTTFSKNLDCTKGVVAKIETGMSFINSGWTSRPEIPFGGIRNSGYSRELSELGFDAFISKHPVFVPNDQLTRSPFIYI